MRRALAAMSVVFLFAGGIAASQSTDGSLDDLFAAQDSLNRGIAKVCQNNPQHPRCGTTTTLAETTTTAAPTTTQAPTTAPTTTQAPTTTLAPTTTAAPSSCQGVQVSAGSNLVNVANAQPAGTTFCLAAGTYTVGASLPIQSNDKWIGALGPNGERLSLLTGNGTTQYLVFAVSQNVLFQNFIIERFNNALSQGVNTGGQTFWTWDNVEVRENRGFALHTHDNSRVTNSFIHHNHQAGLGGHGDNVLIENNEISHNNYLQEHDPNWEAGGSKWVAAVNLTVRGNYVHDNCGAGLWTDINNSGVLYENNRVINNAGWGIFHEISFSAVIRDNYVEGNGLGLDANPGCSFAFGPGIYVSESSDVEVYGNVLVNNNGGIQGVQQDRGSQWVLKNLNVHDNNTTLQVGWTGFRYIGGPNENTNIRFENNHYDVPTLSGTWWMFNGLRTWSQWQALGHDLTGTFE